MNVFLKQDCGFLLEIIREKRVLSFDELIDHVPSWTRDKLCRYVYYLKFCGSLSLENGVLRIDESFYNTNPTNLFEDFEHNSWKAHTVSRLGEILSRRDLEELLGSELSSLIRSLSRKEFNSDNITKKVFLNALISTYDKGLLIHPEMGSNKKDYCYRTKD